MFHLPEGPPTLDERVAIELQCDRSAEFRELVRQRCARDSAWFISAFGWTFDPRPDAPHPDLPFVLHGPYAYQADIVRWIDERIDAGEDGIIEKSREMGLTWIVVGILVRRWLFQPGFQALFGSSKEDKVDNRLIESHFGKLDYFIRRLPGWLLPSGWNPRQHRNHMRIVNPENGNAIAGDSANPEFSRQGRYTVIFYDEAAFWPDLNASWRAGSQSARCRIAVSTANGQEEFYRLRSSGLYKVLTVHYSLDPRKDKQWYLRQCERDTPETIAQELDISYTRSVRDVVYPGWADIPRGSYPFEQGWSLYTAWDFGVNDDTAIIWIAQNPQTGKFRAVDCYSNRGKPIDFYVPFVLGRIPQGTETRVDESGQEYQYTFPVYAYTPFELEMINRHATWGTSINFGDPSGKARAATTATSPIEVLRQHKVFIHTNDAARDFRSRYMATQLVLRQFEGINLPECIPLDESITNARFPPYNPDTRSVAEVNRPIHNWTSHFRSALEYFCVNINSMHGKKRRDPVVRQMAYDSLRPTGGRAPRVALRTR
jgi:hypothetical protein